MELLLSFSVVLNYSIDVWAELGFLEMQQMLQQMEEKDCEQTNLVSCLHDEGNAFNTFVGAPGFTQYVLMSNSECKQNFCLFTRKAPRGIFWRCQMKDVFLIFSDWKAAKLSPSLTFFDVIFRPAFLSIRCLSEQNRLLFFRNSKLCENLSVTLNLWNHHVSAGFSSRPIRASPLIAETYNHHAVFVPIHRRPAAIMSGDKGECDFLHCSPLSHSGFYIFFFFSCDPNLRQFFFPSCRSALSSSGSATYYLQPETQLRQKVSQTERERESLTERIRGENSRSWMNEGLKMTQKNCFPCSPWVILSEQLSAFSSRWLSHRNNKPCVRRLS